MMDRVNGAGTVDIGAGRRGFRDEDLETGIFGTEVTALWLNSIQEEILRIVSEAGLAPNAGDWSQLYQALKILGLNGGSRARRWMAVNSVSLSSAPGSPAEGDAYLIPPGATGIWAGNEGKIAEWTGASWSYLTTPNGHAVSIPDGRVFEKVGGSYGEMLATESRSGLVELATVAEALAGADVLRAVTSAGLSAAIAAIMPPRPNLCPNGGFEDGLTGINILKSGVGAWNGQIVDNDWGRSISLTVGSSGTYVVLWPKFPVNAGITYTVSGDAVLLAAGGTVGFDLEWTDASNTVISYVAPKPRAPGDFDDGASGRQSMAVSGIAPAGAVSARVRCVFFDTVDPVAMYARYAKVERGNLPATAYTSRAKQSAIAGNGYIDFTGGLTMQWGTGWTADGTALISFPKAFSAQPYVSVGWDIGASTWTTANASFVGAGDTTPTTAVIRSVNWTGSAMRLHSANFSFIALGPT
ncbi:DUF2793 domain-containing protein [Rhizobium sp. SL86]|uniref:DUF2793 domain-containing protein n=1 Tax=Rhizobium sp. SL86 TaxID=2995148 RepID=UPI002277057D|nr:DUF2793 domain-containing protein [Rhizobium sp. SL86]MCY1668311.1 DUF2793 domain-containing protein [Rhizobium sp. SL86]